MSRIHVVIVALILSISFPVLLTPNAQAQNINGIPEYSVEQVENEDFDEIKVQTRLAHYLISEQGGLIQSVYVYFSPIGAGETELVADTITNVQNRDPWELQRITTRNPLFPLGLTVNGIDTSDSIYDCNATPNADQALEISCSLQVEGVVITKIYTIAQKPNYSIEFDLEIENNSDADVTLSNGLLLTLGDGLGESNNYRNTLKYLYSDDVRNEIFDAPGFEGLGFHDRGLLFFLKSEFFDNDVYPFESEPSAEGRFELGLQFDELFIRSGETRHYDFLLYAGRDKFTLLEEVGLGRLNRPSFFLQFIIPVVYLLNWLYNLTGNYGWAILIFTLITRILLFPLFRKQSHSFARMAEIKPKMDKIQQRYPGIKRLREIHPNMGEEELMKRDRENKQAMQEKLMELYRSENVNPLGGCLPLLVQFPILIILWQTILYSAEAIHFTPGFLWMPDLALKDPTYVIMGLTVLVMIFQTRTAPKMATQQQGPNPMFMMLIFVGIMVIALRDFPAGLWLYYFSTTVVQVVQQLVINREMQQIAAKREAATSAGVTVDVEAADEEASQTELTEADAEIEGDVISEDDISEDDSERKTE